MKNLPETNFWNSIKARLGNYQEMPADDTWDKIAGAIPPVSPRSHKAKKALGITAVFLAGTFAGVGIDRYLTDVAQKPSVVNVDKQSSEKSLSNAEDSSTINLNARENARDLSASVDKSSGNAPTSNPSDYQNDDQIQQTGYGAIADDRHVVVNDKEKAVVTNSIATKMNSVQAMTLSEKVNRDVEQSINQDSDDHIITTTTTTTTATTATLNGNATDATTTGRNNKSSQQIASDQLKTDSIQQEKESVKGVKIDVKKGSELRKPKILKGANIYAIITPSLSFQKITPSKNDELEVIDFESPGVLTQERAGWSFDAGYQGILRKHFEWYAGLSYYQQQQTLTYRYNTGEYELQSTGKGHTMIPIINTNSFSYNMRNVGASAGLFYTLKHGGLQHKLGAGLSFQKGLLRSGDEQSYNNASTTYFNYQLSYRLEMAIKPQWVVFLQPTFVHSILSNESLEEPFELKPYRAGIGLGVIYRF